jgi:transporter family protein
MTAKWLVPSLAYVGLLGALGVTSKLALRTLSWQDILLWTTVGYVITSIVLLGLGQTDFHWQGNTWWAAASAGVAIGALICLYLALGSGEAGKVIPITAAYPAVALILSALFLSEGISAAKVGGVALVVGGVIVLTSA